MSTINLLLRLFVFAAGFLLVAVTLSTAIKTYVLPRSANTLLSRLVFRSVFALFRLRLKRVNTYEQRDHIMAMFAPTALLATPVVWLIFILLGYTAMYWATGIQPLKQAFILSGSSLFTLGFATDAAWGRLALIYSEATLGLGLVALLLAYLPTMYAAFSTRERSVAMLEVRAGSPPSAVELLSRAHRLNSSAMLDPLFAEWEIWFANLEESHTSLAALVFFRSPQSDRSWVTASGAILDSAALYLALLQPESTRQAALCIRAGYIALRRVADFFQIAYDADPKPDDPVSISREEFNLAYNTLAAAGLPIVADRDQAWRNFNGWRVNYDTVLVALAALTMAPYAPWSSDRSVLSMHLPPSEWERLKVMVRRMGDKKEGAA